MATTSRERCALNKWQAQIYQRQVKGPWPSTLTLAFSCNATWQRLCEKCCAVVSPVMQVGIALSLQDVVDSDNSKEPGTATYLAASAPATPHLCSTAASRETTGSFFLRLQDKEAKDIRDLIFFPIPFIAGS